MNQQIQEGGAPKLVEPNHMTKVTVLANTGTPFNGNTRLTFEPSALCNGGNTL